MIHSIEELRKFIQPMLESMPKGAEKQVTEAILTLIEQDREAHMTDDLTLVDKIMAGEIVTVKGNTLLTGRMWYERFKKELGLNDPIDYGHEKILPETAVVMAAKKASGLIKGDKS